MSRYTIAPLKARDYVEALNGGACIDEPAQVASFLFSRGPAFTARVDGGIACVAGFAFLWRGVAEAWAVVTPLGWAHPMFIHRNVAVRLHQLIHNHGVWRLQASVKLDFAKGRRWVEALGFEEESVMERFGPNREPFMRYVMLPKDG